MILKVPKPVPGCSKGEVLTSENSKKNVSKLVGIEKEGKQTG